MEKKKLAVVVMATVTDLSLFAVVIKVTITDLSPFFSIFNSALHSAKDERINRYIYIYLIFNAQSTTEVTSGRVMRGRVLRRKTVVSIVCVFVYYPGHAITITSPITVKLVITVTSVLRFC